MKYFTPELLERFRSPDPAIADAASKEWDRALAEYEKHLESIRGKLPEQLKDLLDNYCLHDARVRAVSLPDQRMYLILAQPEDARDHVLLLSYRLVREPEFVRYAPGEEAAPAEWMYEEIDVEQQEPPVYSQSVLLSDGRELRLHFRDMGLTPLPLPVFEMGQQLLADGLQPLKHAS